MPSSPLSELWLRGVAANPAAPSEVLLRLLDPAARAAWRVLCEYRDLPADVIDAVVAHPERGIRRALARSRCVGVEQRARLVSDPDYVVRADLAAGPRPRMNRVEPLPDHVLETLLTARNEDDTPGQLLTANEIAAELMSSGQISQSFRRRMLDHKNPELRRQAAAFWFELTPGQRDALLADPDPSVRRAAQVRSGVLDDLPEDDSRYRMFLLVNYALSRTVVEACLAEGRDLWALAHNRHTPADAVARLARDPEVRRKVAGRADLDASLLAELAEDPDDAVRTRALVQPLPRTPAQCAAIDRIIDRMLYGIGPVTEMLVEPDPSWYAACAVSADVVLRRVAATCPLLPEELVQRLAEDPDTDVRHLLAINHPLAPPATILEAFIAKPYQRPYLLTLARLPRTGLQALLDHEDPELRALAAADTTLDRPPVHLLTDPESDVRRAAAANPLMPPELLPALLEDPGTAEGAAANPNLPTERLHALLDLTGLSLPSAPAAGPPGRP